MNQTSFITSALLANAATISHGFFTRHGGVSEGIYASLNCGAGSRDQPERVRENRQRVLTAMGGAQLCTVHQCHTANVMVVGADYRPSDQPMDALVTATPGMVLGILTADCAPVLLADARAGVIGAAHAGWKGAVGGVVEATIAAMQQLGAAPQHIIASIGPCIAQKSYQVGAEFRANLLALDAANAAFFAAASGAAISDKYYFDLGGYVAARLRHAGVGQIDRLPHDTCAQADMFFSYRRSCLHQEADYGRQISCIIIGASNNPF